MTKASEQDSAESQQPKGLPEVDRPQSKQRRRQPVPQKLHNFAADPAEDGHPQDRQWSYQKQFRQSRHVLQSLSHVVFLTT
jgi:hypothetical protein